MSEELRFDEDKAIEFIRATLPEEVNKQYDDDDILYIIDIIWDWYEKNGYLEITADVTDEEVVKIEDLTDYVRKQLAKDKNFLIDTKDVGLIVKGELQYEESIEDPE